MVFGFVFFLALCLLLYFSSSSSTVLCHQHSDECFLSVCCGLRGLAGSVIVGSPRRAGPPRQLLGWGCGARCLPPPARGPGGAGPWCRVGTCGPVWPRVGPRGSFVERRWRRVVPSGVAGVARGRVCARMAPCGSVGRRVAPRVAVWARPGLAGWARGGVTTKWGRRRVTT